MPTQSNKEATRPKTVAELQEILKERGIKYTTKMKRDELAELVAGSDPKPVEVEQNPRRKES